jgi:hypothetical protein
MMAVGGCVGAATRLVRGLNNILEGEAMGLNVALDFVDANTIVCAVNHRRYPQNYWGRIARRCGEFLIRNPRLSISWARRTRNIVAQVLINWASIGDGFRVGINVSIVRSTSPVF